MTTDQANVSQRAREAALGTPTQADLDQVQRWQEARSEFHQDPIREIVSEFAMFARFEATLTRQAGDGEGLARELLYAELNPAHASQLREGRRNLTESMVPGDVALRAIISALEPAAPSDVSREDAADLWQELVEMDDRTSPEEYPDHALITRDEFIEFCQRAALNRSDR